MFDIFFLSRLYAVVLGSIGDDGMLTRLGNVFLILSANILPINRFRMFEKELFHTIKCSKYNLETFST